MTDELDEWLRAQKRARREALNRLEALVGKQVRKRVLIRRRSGQVLISVGSFNATGRTVDEAMSVIERAMHRAREKPTDVLEA